ncbi:MAG: glycosyltransferase [Rhodobacteraceae bacterium]|nr:glycosyltransferase [Paracoccaceae bacterium]
MTSSDPALSVIIAARNEEALIGRCLGALAAQEAPAGGGVEVIVAANGCTDSTVAAARRSAPAFAARGWRLAVLDLAQGGKLGALRAGEAEARGRALVYLDADVVCEPPLLARLAEALDTGAPRYATGRLRVAPAQTAVTRAYARIWTRLPFVQGGAVGAGLFAVNRAGRARWGAWPEIISDDTFARLHFTPQERVEVPADFQWPMVEGFGNLVRVRRRQDAGVAEIARLYPDLMRNEGKAPVTPGLLARLGATDPAGLAVYLAVHLAVRLKRKTGEWTRGR